MNAVKIKIDPDLGEELVIGYFENRKKELSVLETFRINRDFESIAKTAHKLKGTGLSYGFDEISKFGELLEKAAITKDLASCETLMSQHQNYINNVILEE